MKQKTILLWAIAFIALAIILGAFGAHALKEKIIVERLSTFETGVRYQMYHGLGLLAIAAMASKWKFNFRLPISLLIIGVFMFSFSLYGLALQEVFGTDLSFLGPITPIGGSVLLAGWVILGVKIFKSE